MTFLAVGKVYLVWVDEVQHGVLDHCTLHTADTQEVGTGSVGATPVFD